MARPLRLEFSGALYHLTARGNAQQPIFLNATDRQHFLDLLGCEILQQHWRCYVYCVMDNHYHLVIETPEPNLSRGLRRLHGTYTPWFNRRHHRVGHVLQGRFKSLLVEKEQYLQELCRYVVLHPCRAGVVSEPAAWPWSRYRATVGSEAEPEWLDRQAVLALFDVNQAHACTAYQRFVADAYRLPQARVLDRSHREAYQTAVYLLRRAANEPGQTVAVRLGISPSRVSKIQTALDAAPMTPTRARAFEKCQVKN